MAQYWLTTLTCLLLLTCPTLGYMDEDLEDETWDSWLDWTDCSVTCGTGFHIRSRTCYDNVTDDVMDLNNCTGNAYEVKPCTKVHCPVDGDWNTWQEWQPCTLSCGQGLRFRGRNCDNPAPAYGGHGCLGSAQDFEACKLRECPVDGSWSKWTHWGTCSSSCEAGKRTRQRSCSNPPPAYGGSDCVGDSSQSTSCFVSVMCPVDGRWTEWSSWSICDKTCGTGSRTRTRMCSNPAPKYNGQNCVGNQAETEPCNTVGCPVDGVWTDWLPWNQCSSTGTCSGTQRKLRLCTNPKPANGGQFCPGEFEKFQPCHLDPAATNCTQDGGWTEWGQWDSCHATCGHGLTGRTRSCTNPEPSGAGLSCFGDYLDSRQCDAPPCPVDGGWSDWTTWFSCSVTCGIGTHQRVRTCTNPRPQGGGRYCVGDSVEDVPCYQSDCADTASMSAVLG